MSTEALPPTLAANPRLGDWLRIDPDGRGLLVRTRSSEQFYLLLNRLAAEGLVEVEAVVPADEDVQAVYQYLIGSPTGAAS